MNLTGLKERIESMEKYHQIEILRILNGFNDIKTNENNNGTFVNLSELPKNVITELEKYTKYVDEQQIQLKIGENKKETIEQNFFIK
jgi:hypothetical protein